MARTETGRPRSLGRLSEIAHVAARHGFGYVFARNRTNGDELEAVSDRGRRLREMLEELGPTFVKFGQLLSTRPDVVPPDIVVELRRLQDDVAPFSYVLVRDVVEAELGLTIDRAFLEFDLTPIASASIGQVHRAVLPDGTEVAVKVQRPTARTQIEADLGLRAGGEDERLRMSGDQGDRGAPTVPDVEVGLEAGGVALRRPRVPSTHGERLASTRRHRVRSPRLETHRPGAVAVE